MKNALFYLLPVVPFLIAGCGGGGSSTANVSSAVAQATSAPTAQEWVLYNAYSTSLKNIELFQLKKVANGTPQVTQLTSGAGIDWLNPKLSPDHLTVAVTRYDIAHDTKTVVIFPLASPGRETIIAGSSTIPCEDPAWSPDSQRILYKQTERHSPYQGRIMEYDLQKKTRTVVTSNAFFVQKARTTPAGQPNDGVDYECSVPSYSRNDNGLRIAVQCFVPDSTGSTSLHEQIVVIDRATKVPTQITSGAVKHWFPAWNPTADQLVYTKNDIGAPAKLYRVNVPSKAESLVAVPYGQGINSGNDLVDPAFSPTGRLAFSVRLGAYDYGGSTKGAYKLFEIGGNPTVLTAIVDRATPELYGADYIQSP